MRPSNITSPETRHIARTSCRDVSDAHAMTAKESVDESAHGRSCPFQDTGWVALGVLLGIATCLGAVHAILPFTLTDALSLANLTVFAMLFASVQHRRIRRPAFARHGPPLDIRLGSAFPVAAPA